MREQRPDPDPDERVVAEQAPGAAGAARFPLWAQRRGKIHVDAVWLRWRGPLGLVELTRRVEVGRAIDVVPNVRGVRSSVLQFLSREALYGNKMQEQKGEGTEFDALRDYVTGMDSRFIDWKHSARHRKLVCKEFRTERNHQIILGVRHRLPDGRAGRRHAAARSCHQCRAAAGWSLAAGRRPRRPARFDARCCGSIISPSAACRPSPRLQRATAGLDYRHSETNFTLGLAELGPRLRRRALVMLFTDFVDTVTAELMIEATQRIARPARGDLRHPARRGVARASPMPPRCRSATSRNR